MSRSSRRTLVAALIGLLGIAACEDLHLATGSLDIGPNPAFPGDAVVASFILELLPTQQHSIVVFIDEQEHLRETRSDPPPTPVILELGDAGDLIASYGAGEHAVHVEVNVAKESTRTQSVTLELREAEAAQSN